MNSSISKRKSNHIKKPSQQEQSQSKLSELRENKSKLLQINKENYNNSNQGPNTSLLKKVNNQSSRIINRTRNNIRSQCSQTKSKLEYTSEIDMQSTQNNKVSHFEKLELIKLDFYESHQDLIEQLNSLQSSFKDHHSDTVIINKSLLLTYFQKIRNNIGVIGQISENWEELCEQLLENLRVQREKSQTMRSKVKFYQQESFKSKQKEEELTQTKKYFERSLSDIRSMYERSQELMKKDQNELELLAHEMKTQTTKLRIKHLDHIRIIEQEILEETEHDKINIIRIQDKVIGRQNKEEQLELTNKISHREYEDKSFSSIENNKQSAREGNKSQLEKTTPRGQMMQQQQQQFVVKQKQVKDKKVPNLPLSQLKSNKDQQFSSIESGTQEQTVTCNNQYQQNDESICAPALLLNDQQCAWDSMLEDDTKSNIDVQEMSFYLKDFHQKLSDIKDPNEKIVITSHVQLNYIQLFKQIYALQHNINSNLLKSIKQQQRKYDCTTPREVVLLNCQKPNNKLNKNSNPCSGDKTCKPLVNSSRNHQQLYSQGNSSQKNYKGRNKKIQSSDKGTDVKLKEIMDVPNAIITESPLPQFELDEQRFIEQDQENLQDVRLEDILNAPSLSVSLKTATEIGLGDESFFRSDEKNGYLRQKTNINDSYLLYYDEASMIKEADHHEEEDNESQIFHLNTKGNHNSGAINIIDQNPDRPESQLENESNSSYSKSQRLEMQNSQKYRQQHHGNLELINEEDEKQDTLRHIVESFKSTAMAKPLILNNQICGSTGNSQHQTPAFYRMHSNDSQQEQFDINRKSNHLIQNHNKLLQCIKEKIQEEQNSDKPKKQQTKSLDSKRSQSQGNKIQMIKKINPAQYQNLSVIAEKRLPLKLKVSNINKAMLQNKSLLV